MVVNPTPASAAAPLPDHLILFTRYPEPGHTKTRLIPALGAEGAADLQRRMTEHMLRHVVQLQHRRAMQVTVQFAGGDRAAMQAWLGQRWDYVPQAEGDLGDRLAAAMHQAFATGAKRVVMCGIDCPTLDAALLAQAFDRLTDYEIVLGPSTDGGYYLIGMNRPFPELFQGIAWSTDVVAHQTEAIAHQHHWTMAHLPAQTDVDVPADLAVWEAVRQTLVSVIIPVLNEATHLPNLLHPLQQIPNVEVLLVDGGSTDNTVAIAQAHGIPVLSSPPGRAQQMNRGAKAASGSILLFLHADTRLPPNFPTWIRHTLDQPGVVAGAFELAIAASGWGYRWVEWGVRWRSRLCQLPYGDQAIFLHASTFEKLGGFPEMPIMEDFVLVQRLKRQGTVAIAPAPAQTSPRRWQALGLWQTTLINQIVLMGYYLGVSPTRLAHWYRRAQNRS